MSPQVQVIIVAYNSGVHLQRCVDALEAQTFQDFEAVVWDNASADGAVSALLFGPRVRVIQHPENLGFATANNRAAALSSSPYIAFLNPDAFPEPDWLERLVDTAKAYGAEAVASLQLDDADPERLDGAGDCMSVAGFPWRGGFGQPRTIAPSEPCEVFSACAAAALYRRDAFEALDGFEERFFCYCEDVDLGFRLRREGGRCVLEPRAVARHVGGASSGGGASLFAERYGTRNRLWTFLRDTPAWLLPLAGPAHLLVTSYVLLRSPHLLKVRVAALKEALSGLKGFAPTGRLRPGDLGTAKALSWSPLALSRRAIVTRPAKRRG